MSYDVGLQPTAQKYFVLALHAAKEAGDRPLGSYVLSMSRQMIHLGRSEDALELIHLAQYGSREGSTPRTQAMLYAMEARAYANMGQPGKCKRAVRMAEETFADIDPVDERPGLDPVLLRGRAVRGERALLPRSGLLLGPQPHLCLAGAACDGASGRAVQPGRTRPTAAGTSAPMRSTSSGWRASTCSSRSPRAARRARARRSGWPGSCVRSGSTTACARTAASAVREYGDVAEVVHLSDQLAIELPETAEAV